MGTQILLLSAGEDPALSQIGIYIDIEIEPNRNINNNIIQVIHSNIITFLGL